MPKVTAIIQARIGSTRLPGKVMMPLLDKPVIEHVVERVKRAKLVDTVIVAFPADDWEHFAWLDADLYGYPGDPSDLIGRYAACAAIYESPAVLRIGADNPCIEPTQIDRLVTAYNENPLSGYLYNQTNQHGHDAFGAELYTRQVLDNANELTEPPEYREHPHKLFAGIGYVGNSVYDANTTDLDMNTADDYAKLKDIFNHFGHNRFTPVQALEYWRNKQTYDTWPRD